MALHDADAVSSLRSARGLPHRAWIAACSGMFSMQRIAPYARWFADSEVVVGCAVLGCVTGCGNAFAPRGADGVLQLSYQFFTQRRRSRLGGNRLAVLGFIITFFLGHKPAVPKLLRS